jgi:formylglycine-generating enzyme required for sulfatase activity
MVSIWLHARLPDEWEWEYACRGGIDGPGDQQPIWWRDDEDELDEYARLASNSGFPTHPVGAKLANPFGLYDVLGNVWEWTSSMSFARDTSRVARGGGFSDELILPCCSSRRVMDPSASDMETGCRVLKDLS